MDIMTAPDNTAPIANLRWLSPTALIAWDASSNNIDARRKWVLRYVYRVKTFIQTEYMKRGEAFDAKIKLRIYDELIAAGAAEADCTRMELIKGHDYDHTIEEPFTSCYMNSGAWTETFRLCLDSKRFGLNTTIRELPLRGFGGFGDDVVLPCWMKPDMWWVDKLGCTHILDWKTKGSGRPVSPTAGYDILFEAGKGVGNDVGKGVGNDVPVGKRYQPRANWNGQNAVHKNQTQLSAYLAGLGASTGVGHIVEVQPDKVSFHSAPLDAAPVVEKWATVWKVTNDPLIAGDNDLVSGGHYWDWLSRDESDELLFDLLESFDLYSTCV